jgi:hypothetical protein
MYTFWAILESIGRFVTEASGHLDVRCCSRDIELFPISAGANPAINCYIISAVINSLGWDSPKTVVHKKWSGQL